MKWYKFAFVVFAAMWVGCVPVSDGPDDDGTGSDVPSSGDSGVDDVGDAIDPGAGRPASGWPAPDSDCETDGQCAAGLVCHSLSEEALEALLESVSDDQISEDTLLQVGALVCQRGCRMDGEFLTPDGLDDAAHGCQSCQPDVSTSAWTPLPAGAVCDDDLFCTSDGGVPGGPDSCDGAGACTGDPVSCDDDLFCTGVELCDEDTDTCESSGDPCPDTECNTCQEDTDRCFDPAGTSCGDPLDTVCDKPDSCDGAGTCQTNYASITTLCRPAGEVCDVAETCNGRGRCREDGFKLNDVVCNPGSGDQCDPDEFCTGTAAACPEDSFESDATVCNQGTGDLCDPDEFCPGIPGQPCPEDTFESATVVCNPGSGDACDPEERCPGVPDQGCPEDNFKPATFVCNAGSGDHCDPDEHCPGVPDQGCPEDTVEPATTVCNPGSGDLCDPDELCPGVPDQGCSADTFEPATRVCNAGSGDMCDPDEFCPGVADQGCPPDSFESAARICNQGSGDLCDPAEVCPGVPDQGCPPDFFEPATKVCDTGSGDMCDPDEHCPGIPDMGCPADIVMPSTTVCLSAAGECDQEELCLGVANMACPQDGKKDSSTECRAPAGDCDAAEVCDGVSNDCPDDEKLGTEVECGESAFPCNEPAVCDGINNECPAADNQLCEDGEACDADEQCASGACVLSVCGSKGFIGEPCDSQPDCASGRTCEGGVCLGDIGNFCLRDDQCSSALNCDAYQSGQCKVPLGGACAFSECADDSLCWNGVCLKRHNASCFRDDDCSDQYGPNICDCQTLAVTAEGTRCSPAGTCKRRPGAACYFNYECAEDYECSGDFDGDLGTCVLTPYGLGRTCEYDPAGGPPHPVLGNSPGDSLCASGHCFKAAGVKGDCTPTHDSEGNPTVCGGPLNPPDYVCCRALSEPCFQDSHCCGRFNTPTADLPLHGCGSGNVCIQLGRVGDGCSTDEDCERTLDCVGVPDGPTPGLCQQPFVAPVLGSGAVCNPVHPNGYCGEGLQCYDCGDENFRCADAVDPCCRNGRADPECGNRTWFADGLEVVEDNLCCDYKCYGRDDAAHCASCSNDCTAIPDDPCIIHSTAACEPFELELGCTVQASGVCGEHPDPDWGYRCDPDDSAPAGYTCTAYVIRLEFNNDNCDGGECTSNNQCGTGSCVSTGGNWAFIVGGSSSCECN